MSAKKIWLVEQMRTRTVGYPAGHGDTVYSSDGDGIIAGTVDARMRWEPDSDAEHLTIDQLRDMETAEGGPCVVDSWDPVAAFPTREKADEYREKFAYRYDGTRTHDVWLYDEEESGPV